MSERAREIDRQTPPQHNRYADFLRTLAIVMVVLGHWVVAYVSVTDAGFVRASTILAEVPQTRWLTWVFQVMPLFFFVGGMVNALSWNKARRRDRSWVDWIRKRSRRLLRPLIALLLFWVAAVLVLEYATATPGYLVLIASYTALLPVWFLAAYLFIVAISPLAWWFHRRIGIGAVVALLVAALVVDLFVNAGVQWVGWANFVVVWTAVHQLGFFWYDRRIPMKPAAGLALAALAVATALWLVQMAGYPVSMVDTGEPGRSNDYPPSMVLVALAAAQIGVVAAAHDRMQRWLQKPLVWAAITTAASQMLTIFLWHMTAMIAVALLVYPTGLWPSRDTVDAVWWLLRIPWVALLAAVLAGLVALFGRFEQPPELEPTGATGWWAYSRAALGVALSALGLTLIVTGGVYTGGGLAGLAWGPLAMVAAGFVALDVVRLPWIKAR